MTTTILLVDDSKTMREVLKVYLMGREFEFLEADTGERGVHLLRLMPVDLVLVDLRMPKMDGLSFLRHVRTSELATMRRVPIIVVTAEKNSEWQLHARAAGADAFLQKPLDAQRTIEVVERLLRRATT
jgi:two-component system chemotaxis response regulator CheY